MVQSMHMKFDGFEKIGFLLDHYWHTYLSALAGVCLNRVGGERVVDPVGWCSADGWEESRGSQSFHPGIGAIALKQSVLLSLIVSSIC